MRLTALLALTLFSYASAMSAQPSCRVRTIDGWWTSPVVLDTVRGDWLVFRDGAARDSLAVREIDVIRRTRTSHVVGGLVGFGAGLLGAIAIVVPSVLATVGTGHSSGAGSEVPLYLAGASLAIGTTWGAVEGLDVHPTDDLTLDGLDGNQRAAALRGFILDSRLQLRD